MIIKICQETDNSFSFSKISSALRGNGNEHTASMTSRHGVLVGHDLGYVINALALSVNESSKHQPTLPSTLCVILGYQNYGFTMRAIH